MQLQTCLETMVSMISKLNRDTEWDYCCFEDFVLKEGRAWQPRPLPKSYRHRTPRHCFYNAQKLSLQRGLIYVEGYALDLKVGLIPFAHGWCVKPGSDDVIDPTWGNGKEYIGVPFNPAYVRRQWREKMKLKKAGKEPCMCLIDDWNRRWPILSGQHLDWRAPAYIKT